MSIQKVKTAHVAGIAAVKFNSLPVNSKFHCNGIDYTKKSSCTGETTKYDKTFYFGQNEVVYNDHFYTDIKRKD